MAATASPPPQLKAIQAYIKAASDIDRVDPVVSYWIRLYSTETALKIDKDSPEAKKFLISIMTWLEQFKTLHQDDDRVTNQTVGQAHFDNFVMNIFNKADTTDREGAANKTTVTMFYMATILFDAMAVFGPLTEENLKRAKYAKFKAAYIQKCLKSGQVPKPGPIENVDLEPTDVQQSEQQSELPSQPQPPILPTTPPSASPPKHYDSPRQPPASPAASNNHSNSNSLVLPETPDREQSQSPSNNSSNQGGSSISKTKFQAINGQPLSVQDLVQGQKYCKFATSALQYDDVETAVANLEKALKLLKTGEK